MSGYVKAYRERFTHDLFRPSKDAPFCKLAAWDWMVARAAWRATKYDVRGKTVTVERGQFVASPDEMAAAWAWSRSHVNRFLLRLQTEHMIGLFTGHNKTLVTVCNYEKYQDVPDDAGQECERNIGHKSDTNRTAKEEREERKKILSEERISARTALVPILGEETADAFVAHRNALRKPMTARAGELMAKKLALMRDPEAAALRSIERGWAGVFEDETVTPFRETAHAGKATRRLNAFLSGARRTD